VKRLITLFLLLLFLLNVLGYYGIFVGLQVKTSYQMRQNFDEEDYDHQEVTFKIPLTVPYSTDSKEYTRVDGEFEHEGDVYRLVKQRLQSDTLYIVCVKDHASKEINQALEDYVKTFSDNPVGSKGSTKNVQSLIKDFICHSISIQKQTTGWQETLAYYSIEHSYELVNCSLTGPPPRG
jgi:hypothetical protein